MSALFTTFDVFPLPKGSSTHIAHTLRGLAGMFGRVNLAALGRPDMPRYQEEGAVTIRRCLAVHPNFLKRTEYFGGFLRDIVRTMDRIECVHFRDVWSGVPLMDHAALAGAVKVFEVNGLPSIELPYHYPAILENRGLLARIRDMEDYCLAASDGVITVSGVTKRYLATRGVPAEKIHVVPNTAESDLRDGSAAGPGEAPAGRKTILYAGTLSSWQGVDTLIEAFRLIAARGDADLFLASSTDKRVREVKKTLRRAGLGGRAAVRVGLPREALGSLYRSSAMTVAPLSGCGRNRIQGCSPLKIIESMFSGTPVVASRLPVCEEIIDHGVDGWLVPPDSPRALALAMEMLLDDPDLGARLGRAARDKMEKSFNINLWLEKFHSSYTVIMGPAERPAGR